MTERDVAAEVLRGLQEVREHRAGKRTLRETRIEPTPVSELDPELAERIRGNLVGSEDAGADPSQMPSSRGPEPDDSGGSRMRDIEQLSRSRRQGSRSRNWQSESGKAGRQTSG